MIKELALLEKLENTIEVGLKYQIYDEITDTTYKLDEQAVHEDIKLIRQALKELEQLRKLN